MNRQKWVLGLVGLLGICPAVLLLATTFQLTVISPTDIERVTWPTGTVTPGVTTVTWSLNHSNSIVYSGGTSSAGVTLADEGALQALLDTAFGLWSGALYPAGTGTNVNNLSFTEGADNTNTSFNSTDCVNSIGFTQNLGTAVIAETVVTTYTGGGATGFSYCTSRTCPNKECIGDADIEFNNSVYFFTPSYTNPPTMTNPGYFDLQTVATHEIGHMVGLDHTGLADAIMFPYGDSGNGGVKYSLATDDAIGSSVLYPNNDISGVAGKISGTVTVGGGAAPAAHVVAIDATTGNVVTDALTDNNGNYNLYLFQGTFYVLTLPLATDTTGDVGTNGVTSIINFNGWTAGYPSATPQTHFTGKYY